MSAILGFPNFGRRSAGRRIGGAALVLFQFFFLNIVIPGHTRGVITLSGKTNINCLADLGCGPCCGAKRDSDPTKAPHPDSHNSCAICSLAAHITPPPAVCLDQPALGFLCQLPPHPPHVLERAEVLPTYLGRGPPPPDASI